MVAPPWFPLRPLVLLGETIMDAARVAAGVGIAGLLVVFLLWVIRGRLEAIGGWLRWRYHRRNVRNFSRAVADGDLPLAESQLQSLFLSPGGLQRRRVPRIASRQDSDVRAVRHQPFSLAASELARVGGPAAWCPNLRPASGTPGTLEVGRARPLCMTVRRHADWNGDGTFLVVGSDGAVVTGQVRLRRVPDRTLAHEAVELWVHFDPAVGRPGRRCLRKLRRATRKALRNWANQTATPRHRREGQQPALHSDFD